MSDADLAYSSIAALGARLRARSLTSLQLTDIYLARIARIGPQLNAFITVTAELARSEAKRADAELTSGRDRGPLHGIPYAVKDLVDTAFIPTTWGCKATLDRIPTQDARIVTQLREAGAVLLGKLSMTELANAFGNNLPSANHGGACRNPWDVTRWAGGSSSGSGSAVAAGLCAFAIGSETWGSIDCPAAYCGVTGFRPTFGIVDRTGAMILCPTLDKLGPLARSTRDAAIVVQTLVDAPLAPSPPALRIGVVAGPVQPPVGYADAFYRVLEVLRGRAHLEPLVLPEHPENATMLVILLGELYGALAPFIQRGGVHQLYDKEPWDRKWSAYLGMGLRPDDYVKAAYVRAAIQRDYRALFERFDVIVTPGRPLLAPVIDERDDTDDVGGWGTLDTVGNLAGLPAITMPMGFSKGLPFSLHAVAAPYDDAKLFAFGELVQHHTEHHRKRPPAG
jgi:aspartyl-tRNA(Asn)/glutamyl-tRNA(Gln) amidotransferase subunit A